MKTLSDYMAISYRMEIVENRGERRIYGFLSRFARSKREGISMNQYCEYLLSRNDAVYSK